MQLTPEQLSARKRRNVALGLALVAFVVLVFISTVMNLQRNQRAALEQRVQPTQLAQ